jgi:NADPH-dependent 2,4-dienoyl-CoA reductase/sulfur reductase-like enzyme/peroxiredoxin family protein/rhodanese-related sulfurtransferase/TusA-related sulfurtransferase
MRMKLVVIGGVAGGMSAAARARRLDERAEIVVFERSAHVSFANCGLPYHIGGVIEDRQKLLLQTPESLRQSLNLDVRTGQEVLAIDRARKQVRVRVRADGREYEEAYDQLVLAPGAAPIRPSLPGVDDPRVLVLRNIEDMDAIQARVEAGARSAVVIGGGYIGVEMAENLRHRGLAVELVEMVDQIMPPLDREMAAPLEDHLRAHGVGLHLGTAAAAFHSAPDGRLQVELKNGERLTADLILLSAGVRPDTALAKAAGLELGARGGIRVNEHLQTSDPDIHAVGDAIEVRHTVLGEAGLIPLAGPANRQGRAAADHLSGRAGRYETTQGTAIVQVFNMTGGCTGASEKTLRQAGRAFAKLYLHANDHAGYFPGATPIHLKVMFDPETGRLLGAQAVGQGGVDKRLDVLATALRAGMTVEDLKDLELAYAPPYGSAKDPVNMAGFIGANLREGTLKLWYAEAYPQGTESAILLDVRGTEEFETWHIPGARHLPLAELRTRLGELPKNAPIRLYCKVGFRSYLAYRILVQNGFEDVATLSGGTDTFRAWHRPAGEPSPETSFEPYAEEAAAPAVPAKVRELDCRGLQCPGPIMRLRQELEAAAAGDEVVIRVSDPGFAADVRAWCARGGHGLKSLDAAGPDIVARIQKGGATTPAAGASPVAARTDRKTFVVFSGDLDKVLAAFVIANGALAMGSEVAMFFTFWGLNALRKRPAPAVEGKSAMDRMFGAMMPCGPEALKLSKMNMGGMGTAMMKQVMRGKQVASLPELIESARVGGAKFIACSMSMDVMGLKKEELIDGIEIGGVAAFLGEADRSGTTLFI